MKYIKNFENYITVDTIKADKSIFRHKLANINNIVKKVEYYDFGRFKPDNNKHKKSEKYYIKYTSIFHRTDGPAVQEWYSNGQKFTEHYYIIGKIHRENAPATQEWYSNGQIRYIIYYINDICHREDGPGLQEFDINGKILRNEYYLNGKEYKIDKWIDELKNMKSSHYEEQLLKYDTQKYNI